MLEECISVYLLIAHSRRSCHVIWDVVISGIAC